MISEGDKVVAIKKAQQDRKGLPLQVPTVGSYYVVSRVYKMRYGLGCQLEGLDHRPYRGYLLYVEKPSFKTWELGWYFEKLETELDFGTLMQTMSRPKELIRPDTLVPYLSGRRVLV